MLSPRQAVLLSSCSRGMRRALSSAAAPVGFVGLGIMGEGMSRNLVKGGRDLVVWNRSVGKCEELLSEYPGKVTIVDSPQKVVEECGLTYAMLSTPEACQEVYEMQTGILSGVGPGKSIVDCATLAVEDMERMEGQVKERGGAFLEAPVSGSKGPAAAGELIFLTAGDEVLYDSISADLELMGKAKFFLGPVGNGTRMKLCVNMTMGTMLSTYGESFAMASASGIQPSQLLEVLQLGVCNSPLLSLKGAKMLAGDHATNFPLKHAQKDMRLAVDLGTNCGLALPIAVSTDVQMKAAMEPPLELRDSDFSAMFEAQKVAGEMALERLRFHLKYNTRRIEDAK